MGAVAAFNPSQQNARDMALVKRTVASDTNDDEFNVFMNYCKTLGLNPLRRQIYALVYNKTDAKKRRMSIIVAIDGFRSVAARSGNYRPDDEEPRYEFDAAAKGPANPLGLVKAVVKVWQHSHGQWFPVTASAFWDEYAPIKEEWSETTRQRDGEWPDGNPRYKNVPVEGATKVRKLDESGKWGSMGRLMLAKCAEALALRKAWPDDFSNVYAPEEMDRATADLLPAEMAAAAAVDERMERIGAGRSISVDWMDGSPIEPVPLGSFADRVMAFMDANREEASTIGMFESRNRHALREFWAASPGDALDLKKIMEHRVQSAGA